MTDISNVLEHARLQPEPTVHPSARVTNSSLGAWTEIAEGTSFTDSSLGDYSYVMQHCQVMHASIGKFCSVASFVRLNPGNHPLDRVTSHHMTYRARQYGFADLDDADFFEWRRASPVTVGHDVWIGHNATVMPGVSIDNGAAIGAGAVVTKDVPPYMVVVGVPGRVLRPRFTRDVIEQLEHIAWWDWSRAQLEARFEDFKDMERFLMKYGR
jgi:phosphonate metabolism protein (transferase hexapeptide repeat family)